MRTRVAGSEGSSGTTFCSSGTSSVGHGAARGAVLSGLRTALSPPTRNIEASIGRANTLLMAMPQSNMSAE